jgi:hypothetical protein
MSNEPEDLAKVERFRESLQGPIESIGEGLMGSGLVLDELKECGPLSEKQIEQLAASSRLLCDMRATLDCLKLKLASLDIPASRPDAP